VTLLSILIIRRRYRVFPWFTLSIAWALAQSEYLFLVHQVGAKFYPLYFYSYWALALMDALIRIIVIWELLESVSKDIQDDRSYSVRALSFGFFIFVACCIIFGWHVVPGGHSSVTNVMQASIAADTLTVGVCLLSLRWSVRYGLRLRSHATIIALGMAGFVVSKMVVHWVVTTHYASHWSILERGLKPLYLICVLGWCIFLYLNEPAMGQVGEQEEKTSFRGPQWASEPNAQASPTRRRLA
jgi:hypothetical protein